MVNVDLCRFVNGLKLICISQLGLTYCVIHFHDRNKIHLVHFGEIRCSLSACETVRQPAALCSRNILPVRVDLYFVCLAEGADFSVRGIVPFSPMWSRGFRDFEICFVEFISWEQAF